MNQTIKFQKGDVVTFGGTEGEVIEVRPGHSQPILVSFENGMFNSTFTEDGRYFIYHSEPLLKLKFRPKKKVSYWLAHSKTDGQICSTSALYKDRDRLLRAISMDLNAYAVVEVIVEE